MDYIELRNNTIIGEDCYVDSKVSSSGNVIVKNNVTLRYDTILARGVEIGPKTYVCPRVMTNNLNSGGIEIGGAKIGENCFIGTKEELLLTFKRMTELNKLVYKENHIDYNDITYFYDRPYDMTDKLIEAHGNYLPQYN